MSPGTTMERVYLELKTHIMNGRFEPGLRLEPVHLARNLAASATPVRDALFRLSGERLVESWHREGFRQPVHNESDLRDLYDWSRSLLRLALRAPDGSAPYRELSSTGEEDDYAVRIGQLFREIALLTDNRELHAAMANVIDRSQVLRQAELQVCSDGLEEVFALEADLRSARWRALRTGIDRFHRRRIAAAGQIVLSLQRPDGLR